MAQPPDAQPPRAPEHAQLAPHGAPVLAPLAHAPTRAPLSLQPRACAPPPPTQVPAPADPCCVDATCARMPVLPALLRGCSTLPALASKP
eukprot:12505427-Alexandrium_andersonii.AAC.1